MTTAALPRERRRRIRGRAGARCQTNDHTKENGSRAREANSHARAPLSGSRVVDTYWIQAVCVNLNARLDQSQWPDGAGEWHVGAISNVAVARSAQVWCEGDAIRFSAAGESAS
jgi:hypothetical protein